MFNCKITKARSLLAVAAIASLTLTASLTACTSGSEVAAGSNARFEDTGTFNEPTPQAKSIAGSDLSSLGPVEGGDYKVGILIKSLTNQYWQQVEAGIEQAKSDFKVETSKVTSAKSETDTSEQLQICQTMLLENYDAFIISPQTTSNLNPCINEMKRKGVPVINIAAPGTGLVSTVYVGSALATDGKLAGEYLADKLPAKAQVAEIQGLPGSSAADLRHTGFETAMKNSDLDFVASVAGDWDEQKAYQRTQDLLSRYPELAGIYAANDTMASAVARAAGQANRDDLVVVGTDGIPLAIDEIRKGNIDATVTPFPFYQGYWALESALRVLNGQDVPLWVNTIDEVVTKDNVDQFFDAEGSAKPDLYK
jgi:ribose transport system substrate-binding protein